ncbi:helix-turn-helix transcriptional regulator [Pseudomonas aeruginosa]|uniref:helix-turn-helix domain-containing protein n=1 Tax=Pseudomonadaceae TaxID=135621 RepID=UPI0018DF05DD|nr:MULTISPECIES: helix-turn-helix transcriptional regulator [Pseudomonas]MBI7027088.1 helix-turn-helix transcriptional regulator [Pseudomonas aeruginosa]MBI9166094.1 helix-turn-helix transcriptional regulator [Pseudomonas aeruginosa]MCO4019164.1 helix-turn-helix transcriptional regulator [Pseudomonas aeruginosa]MCY0310899.1 helix-turn-helix transcriptional regulator [Pseudomonas aeruginosa]MCY0512851.1 helix-turn-helix transcriptional regulator [Pseudomonas aeruginosa]
MTKAIYRPEYEVFLQNLKRLRIESGLTQAECSAALGRPQSFMSDVERGVRRLDIVQLRDLCLVLGTDLTSFSKTYERALTSDSSDT